MWKFIEKKIRNSYDLFVEEKSMISWVINKVNNILTVFLREKIKSISLLINSIHEVLNDGQSINDLILMQPIVPHDDTTTSVVNTWYPVTKLILIKQKITIKYEKFI